MAKEVTIQLNADNYSHPMFVEGDKIKLGKNSWWMAARRIKTKQMIHRMLKKEYFPYMKVIAISEGQSETTLSIKPYNF